MLSSTLITVLPYIILTAGTYTLSHDVILSKSTTGGVIEVRADNVTLDLGGHTVTNTAGHTNLATGITANNVRKLTVRNGSLHGFLYGVYVGNTSGGTVNAKILDLKTSSTYIGIWTNGKGNLIESCKDLCTGSAVLPSFTRPTSFKMEGEGATLLNSSSLNVNHVVECMAVHFNNAKNSLIKGCTFQQDSLFPKSYCIWTNGPGITNTLIVDNVFQNWGYGISPAGTKVESKDNIFQNVTFNEKAIPGLVDLGGNVHQ